MSRPAAVLALIAHRGYARYYPENTLPALDAAFEAGARYIEVDVQLSSDGVPVLFHDRTLARLCGVEGAVHEHPLAELKTLRASDRARFGYRFQDVQIADLTELRAWLKEHPEVTVFVEIKRIALQQYGIERVLSATWRELLPVLRQCILISYSLQALAAARRQGWPQLGAVIDRWRERHHPLLRQIRPDFIFCDVRGLPRFGRLRADSAKIAVFEVDDPGLARRLYRRGAAFIETFAIGELRDGLALGKS